MSRPVVASHEVSHGSVRTYTIGFGLSLALTLIAYVLTTRHTASGWALMITLSVLAVSQLFVQLVFFLHLAQERRPRWNLSVLLFAVMVVGILVFGSLWIMKNLSYNHRQPAPVDQSDQTIIKDEGYKQ